MSTKTEDPRVKKLLNWLDILIAESGQPKAPAPVQEPPKCWRCGQVKSYDLFKGEYCNRCNDWC